ncbi:MAG: hypothetical protein R3A45_04845 [Bdellovibrionota bacterium]|nr:hypothetical protein [Deltaproteobacteria bacterium]
MKVIKRTKEHTIFQKKSGRYAVKDANKKWINADEKVRILVAAKLVKITPAKPKEEPAAEVQAESTEATEASA